MASLGLLPLLSGRAHARHLPAARQMQNFSYILADRDSAECVLVDPAWSASDLLAQVDRAGLTLVGVLATHHHADHVGGELGGMHIEGVAELMALRPCPVHVHALDADALRRGTGWQQVVTHQDGDTVAVGGLDVSIVHTPGHTPGSVCYRAGGILLSGDTLFARGHGRTDLPGGDPAEMIRSLTERLPRQPPDTTVFPGHDYGGARFSLAVGLAAL